MDQLSKCYQLLGLEVGASQEQVRQAYRDLVNVWHPDRFSHDQRLRLIAQEKLKEINGAHEFLKASFFEASIASVANATSEAEAPNTEPDEEILNPAGNRGAMWLVSSLLIFALAGAAVLFLKTAADKNAAPPKEAFAISQTNGPNHPVTNFASAPEATSNSIPPQIVRPLGIGNGLTPVSHEDGVFTISEYNGVHCWLVAKHKTFQNYFYLKVDDHSLVQPRAKLEINLTYFDNGSGDIALNYDSTDFQLPDAGAYKWHPNVIHRLNSGQWKLARFYVNDARFANRENSGADFRFYNGGDPLLISAVQVLRK
jgi:hypothetical protein